MGLGHDSNKSRILIKYNDMTIVMKAALSQHRGAAWKPRSLGKCVSYSLAFPCLHFYTTEV